MPHQSSICASCNTTQRLVGRGLCNRCYQRAYRLKPHVPRSPLPTFTCQQCGSPFTRTSSQISRGETKYCSVDCARTVNTPPAMATCQQCGATFRARPCRIKAGTKKYCSRTCAAQAQTKPKPEPKPRPAKIVRACEVCGGAFTVAPANATKRFCSMACKHIGHRVPRIQCTCIVCGKVMLCYPIHQRKYCSQSCYDATIVPVTAAERRRQATKRWRVQVLARDGHRCQHCGATGCKLNAHHVKPWAKHPELRTDLSNGITLCEVCHFAVHWPDLPNPYAA